MYNLYNSRPFNNYKSYKTNKSYKTDKTDKTNKSYKTDKTDKINNCFEIKDMNDFPELNKKNDKNTIINLPDKTDYISKVKIENEVKIDNTHILNEGWMNISRDEKGTIKYDPPFIPLHNFYNTSTEYGLNKRMNICIRGMIEHWDAYKQDFIEYYGNDMYDTVYSNYYDYSSSFWEESNTDDEDFSDYDSLDESFI
jgi:hypothetical protein